MLSGDESLISILLTLMHLKELYHFNIHDPLIVGVALSAITSLVHICVKFA